MGALDAASDGWPVVIKVHDGPELFRHVMPALADSNATAPRPVAGGLDAPKLATTLKALCLGAASNAQAEALGDHLWNALVADSWAALEPRMAGAALVDLALHLDDAPALAALPWELMRRDKMFLAAGVMAAGKRVETAITRRVKRARAEYPLLIQPLRYLFAVGAELDDTVRAGAECLGLLRQVAPSVRERIVQRQSLDHLGSEINALDPHVVHIICHGREGGAKGTELEMWNDNENKAEFVSASLLCDRLVRMRGQAWRAPTVVILSACSSGQRLAAATSTDIATQLVQRGVPVVVGMAAEIRDLACRLFTRGLGVAVAERTPLLAAAIAGRSAALRSSKLPANSFDWALVQLVIGDDIDATIAVRERVKDSDEDKVMTWLTTAGLPLDFDPRKPTYPPLCGATEVLDGFNTLVAPDDPAQPNTRTVLLLHAQPPKIGVKVGKRRAFAEVAAAAIRAGHIPVIVLPSRAGAGYPTTPDKLIKRLDEALFVTRSRLTPKKKRVNAVKSLVDPSGVELRAALEEDLLALRDDAHLEHDFLKRAQGEVLLMLHDVHLYADAAKTALELLGQTGAGVGTRIRVIMSWSKLVQGDSTRSESLEIDLADRLREGASWIIKVDLLPLKGTVEDLAYQRVLLNPFRSTPKHAAQRWFFDPKTSDAEALRVARRRLNRATNGGCPGQFCDDNFLDYLEEAVDPPTAAIRPADDDDVLKEQAP